MKMESRGESAGSMRCKSRYTEQRLRRLGLKALTDEQKAVNDRLMEVNAKVVRADDARIVQSRLRRGR